MNKSADQNLLLSNKVTLLDGAMGTMLQEAGIRIGEIPESLNLTQPQLILDIHQQYLNAGSKIIYANTFGANTLKLADTRLEVGEVVGSGISLAKKAVRRFLSSISEQGRTLGYRPLVALDMGPLGELLHPNGQLAFESAVEYFATVVRAGAEAGCDLIVIETMTDPYEAKAAVIAAKENSDLPIFLTMSYEKDGRTFTGSTPAAQAALANGLGVAATGINCSLGPEEIIPLIQNLKQYTDLPLIVKANAGLPDPATGAYDVDANMFANAAEKLVDSGVTFVGGCCGTNPTYIQTLMRRLGDREVVHSAAGPSHVLCSSFGRVVIGDRFSTVGERINPTGKPEFRQAILDGDMGHIQRCALEQEEAGADILDVNVGVPEIDEANFLRAAIPLIQSVSSLPLQIDSSDERALEAGLRVYNGKALVNSVNGKQEELEKILPIVKRYGAAVVGLTLDERGIPDSADERVAIARRIMEACDRIGIPREDLVIDCLALTVSAQAEGASQTLEAVRKVSDELGLKTILGISNISFGLPNRELINRTFLAMAMDAGLNLAIVNPNDKDMMDTVACYRLLSGQDVSGTDFIARFARTAMAEKSDQSLQSADSLEKNLTGAAEARVLLREAVIKGLPGQAEEQTENLSSKIDMMEIVNEVLIPALDFVGEEYETGRIFLPQLIQSAHAAQKAFGTIRSKMRSTSQEEMDKGTIIVATVEGDVHDIGKNIVKVILENYGYRVIDLGKNVPVQTVVDKAIEENVGLIGLSALMTTTLHNMAHTIHALRESGHDCKIMAGGAVLTAEYAAEIGADYYVKDAKASVDAAKEYFGAKS
ncbi:MAG: homocysteine S-methyltransferase family protein [Fastidiosipilaceae bacterium]|jgi:5-methyltetrahydrofolate--homocysteine methyltransferase